MINWQKIPLFRFVVNFILGIVMAYYLSHQFTIYILVVIGIMIWMLSKFSFKSYVNQQLKNGILMVYASIFLGFLYFKIYQKSPYPFLDNQFQNIKIIVNNTPEEKEKTYKIRAKIIKAYKSDSSIDLNENLLLYLSKSIEKPKYGQILFINAKLESVKEPENPYQFNFKNYLAHQQIYYQCFLFDTSRIKVTHEFKKNIILSWSYQCAEYLKHFYKTHFNDPIAIGTLEALVFGYKNDLDKTLIESYAKTGTLHVLAVSGMHVGLIFFLLNYVLSFFDRNKKSKIIKSIFVLFCIWAYCFITGLSPSILRSGIMISFVIIGQLLNKTSNIYNTLSASALIILLINPNWVFDVGFQLSYLAVLGIIAFQNPLLRMYKPKTWLGFKIWEIIVISIAAQLGTFPLSIYLFSQFPYLFIISNLIIIPITTLIIILAIISLLLFQIPAFIKIGVIIIEFLIKINNSIIQFLEKLPYSYQDGIQFTPFQTILLYISILLFLAFLYYQKFKYLKYSATFIIVILSISIFNILRIKNQSGIVSFSIPKKVAIMEYKQNMAIIHTNILESGKLMFYIRTYLINNNLYKNCKINYIKIDTTSKYAYFDINKVQIKGQLLAFEVKSDTKLCQLDVKKGKLFITYNNNYNIPLNNNIKDATSTKSTIWNLNTFQKIEIIKH